MSYRHTTVEQYEVLRARGAQFVDVRSPEDFSAGSVPEAVNIPFDDLYRRISELDRDLPVVLVGQHGGDRSVRAAVLLNACEFGDVCTLDGGVQAFASLQAA